MDGAGPWQSGTQSGLTLTGAELVSLDAGGAVGLVTTTGAIAALGPTGTPLINSAVTANVGTTFTGPQFAGSLITRTGPTGAYSDTTPTAAQIIAAVPGVPVGGSFELTIKNGTAFAEMLLAGANVTLPAVVVIPANSTATYLVTLTSAAAVTLSHVTTSLVDGITPAQFTTAALAAGTLAAASITGATFVVLQNIGATPGAQTFTTAAALLAAFPQARVGMSYMLRIVNTGAGTLTLTADGGATVTITGTATIATNTFRDYIVTFNTATSATVQSVGSGVSP